MNEDRTRILNQAGFLTAEQSATIAGCGTLALQRYVCRNQTKFKFAVADGRVLFDEGDLRILLSRGTQLSLPELSHDGLWFAQTNSMPHHEFTAKLRACVSETREHYGNEIDLIAAKSLGVNYRPHSIDSLSAAFRVQYSQNKSRFFQHEMRSHARYLCQTKYGAGQQNLLATLYATPEQYKSITDACAVKVSSTNFTVDAEQDLRITLKAIAPSLRRDISEAVKAAF